mgnify:CR=1 FL=1
MIYLRTVVEIIVISPENRKRALKCCDCEMTYTIQDYDTLFSSEKLIYFKFKPVTEKRMKIYCHGCLLSAIYKSYPFEEILLKITDATHEYHCRYYTLGDDDDPDFLSGVDDIFKK